MLITNERRLKKEKTILLDWKYWFELRRILFEPFSEHLTVAMVKGEDFLVYQSLSNHRQFSRLIHLISVQYPTASRYSIVEEYYQTHVNEYQSFDQHPEKSSNENRLSNEKENPDTNL